MSWTSQNQIFKNLIHNFRLIENQFRLIETDKSSFKFFKNNFNWSKNKLDQSKQTETHLNFEGKTQFWKKTKHILGTPQNIEIDEENTWVCDEIFFKNNSFKPSFPKIKIFNHIPFKFPSIKYVLHKTQGMFKLDWSNQKHTQLHVQCLAKSNLCSVCN